QGRALPVFSSAQTFRVLVSRNGPQPAAKTLAGVVVKGGQLFGQEGKNVLDKIFGVRLVELESAPRPVKKERAIELCKSCPSIPRVRLPQSFQQADGRGVHGLQPDCPRRRAPRCRKDILPRRRKGTTRRYSFQRP